MSKISILFFAFLFFGCAYKNPYQTAAEIESWVTTKTPYKKNIFDCKERASLAMAMLDEEGFDSFPIRQKNKYYDIYHRCVEWRKGNSRGEILCFKGDGWERV